MVRQAGAILDPAKATRRSRRVAAGRPGRAYLSVRGVHRPGTDVVADAVEEALEALEGVHWAQVNPVLAEVAVAFEDGTIDVDDLAGVLDAVEDAHGLGDDEFHGVVEHPADERPIRRGALGLAADAAGVGIGTVARLLRFPALPVEMAAAVPAIDSFPAVRRVLDVHPGVETATVLANAILQGLGQGPLGLVVDGVHRVSVIAELAANRRAWLDAEPTLHPGPASTRPPAEKAEPRPAPLPAGPVETYGQAASLGSLAGGGLTLALTRNPRRTADVLMAGLPRAARLGREAFAAQIGRTLAAHQTVVMDPHVLRRLDRIDTVVIDADAAAGRRTVDTVVAFGAQDPKEAEAHARNLLDPWPPDAARQTGGWRLASLEEPSPRWPRGARVRARHLASTGAHVSCLVRDGVVVAIVTTRAEVVGFASAVAEVCRQAGYQLVVAGRRDQVAAELGADRTVAGGARLARSVRALQGDGAAVALVSSRPGAALRAADCGIGVLDPHGAHPPWGADVLCLHAVDAATVIDACRLARTASRQAVALAAAGSAAGAWVAVRGLPGAPRRVMTAMQLSTLVAMGMGTWTGVRLPRSRPADEDRPLPWHALDADDVLARLGSSREGRSATPPPAEARADEDRRGPGLVALVAGELSNPLSVILGAGAALSAAAGSVADAGLIAGVLGVDAVLGAAQRLRTEAAIGRLSAAVSEGVVRVLRDGREVMTDSQALVPGDVVRFAAGDAVPADCRVVDASDLETDESFLTGESLPVAKHPEAVDVGAPVADRSSMLYGGTAVATGRATAVVVATGSRTESRRGTADVAPPPTGVESRLRTLTERTVPVVLGAGAGLALNGLVRGRPASDAVASGVSLAAAAVPEGLPFVATVAQASAAHRLADRGVLVRNPQVLEALGRVDVLCFDKTGTLTEGRLRVRWVSDGQTTEPVTDLGPVGRRILAAALRATPRPRPGGLPHPTDQAIVDSASAADVRSDEGMRDWHKTRTLPFEPGRAYHAVLGQATEGPLLSVKGAPEVILPRCDLWRRSSGRTEPLDAASRARAEAELDRLARGGFRVLAVAERPASERSELDDDRIDRLELLGFVGVADTARPSAPIPLDELRRAGIDVVMITGDHPATARAVAADLGLLDGRSLLTGPQLDDLGDAEFDGLVGDVGVFARVTPAHKVRIVSALQRAGRVVAMTGDGANDAQAIRLAQIGVAFGSRATSAARDAADLVVTRDDLSLLVGSIAEGRAMWASVRDALAILLGGNLGEVVFTTGAALIAGDSPLTPRQLLAVNLFTDLAPSMAIAMQPRRDHAVDLAREGPETSLGGQLARDVAIRATATAAAAYGAWIAARVTGTSRHARTVALAALVEAQMGQTLLVGRHSPLVAATALVSTAGLFGVIQTPGLSQFFGCEPLGPVGWTIAMGSAGLATAGAAAAGRLLA